MKKLSQKAIDLNHLTDDLYKQFCKAEDDNNTKDMETYKALILANVPKLNRLFDCGHKYKGVNC